MPATLVGERRSVTRSAAPRQLRDSLKRPGCGCRRVRWPPTFSPSLSRAPSEQGFRFGAASRPAALPRWLHAGRAHDDSFLMVWCVGATVAVRAQDPAVKMQAGIRPQGRPGSRRSGCKRLTAANVRARFSIRNRGPSVLRGLPAVSHVEASWHLLRNRAAEGGAADRAACRCTPLVGAPGLQLLSRNCGVPNRGQ